ncbi:uncharacterized protein LOC134823207 [Bolinopsis microptera]|uniref:uncharacterized protein LOC134823207 n=1 Tax=Bolinopsis microptera TaxID=2820187 RepID=UPI003078E418
MSVANTVEQPAPCTAEATGEYSIAIMKEKLNSPNDDVCGFRHQVTCLGDGTCTLDTDKTDCRYEDGKVILEYFVNLTPGVWTPAERELLIVLKDTVQFWSCSNLLSTGTGMQQMVTANTVEQPAPCTAEATGEYSIAIMKEKLNSPNDDVCGFRHQVTCLGDGTCTLDTDKTVCRYEDGKVILEYFVNLTPGVWTPAERHLLIVLKDTIQFWSCSNLLSTGTGMQQIVVANTVEQPAPCTAEATGEYSIAIMKEKLNSPNDDVCGFRHQVTCLGDGTCTLDTDKTDCRYEDGKVILEYFVNLTPGVWTPAERELLIVLKDRIQFWSCSNLLSTGTGLQQMVVANTVEQPAPCTAEATGEYSIAIMKEKLNSPNDDVCGFRHQVTCLGDGTCTLDTDKTDCRYEDGKVILEYFVNLTPGVWTPAERHLLIVLKDRIQFWSCSNDYNKR